MVKKTSTQKNVIEDKTNNSVSITDNNNSLWSKALTISLVAVFILMTIMSFWYGISGDEVDMNEYGKAILKYYTSFGSDQTVFNMPKEYNRDGVIQYYGGLFDLICAIFNKISPLNEYTTRHILNAWAGFIAILFAAKISTRILSKQAGLLCVWVMFLSPFFLGHAMNNPKDIPFATAYIIAIYCIIRLFDHMPTPSKKDYLWAILSIGATINVRVGGILLVPYLFVFIGILLVTDFLFLKQKLKVLTYIKPVLIVGLLGYLCGSLLWPYGLKNPFSNPLEALTEMSNFKVNIAQVFEGQRVYSGELPTNFLPKSFLITNSFALLLGICLFMVFIWGMFKNKSIAIVLFVFFTAFFPFFYIIYQKSNVYHAWRHVLFVFPSIAIVSSVGWVSLSEYLERKKLKNLGMILVGILLLEPAIFIATTFPNTITYHNAIVGGVNGAYGNYEMDYYYNSLKQCSDWFKDNELKKYKNTDTIVIATNAAHLESQYFKNIKNVKIVYTRYRERNEKPWDYAIFHIALIPAEEIRAKTWYPENSLFVAKVNDNPLSAVYKRPSQDDIRGQEALRNNKPDEAVHYFAEYLKHDPKNIGMLTMTGNILLQMNKVDSAAIYVKKAYDIDPTIIDSRKMMGLVAISQGKANDAITIFRNIIEENDQYVEAYFYLGLSLEATGNHQEAINNLNTAAQEPSLAPRCYQVMGDIFTKINNPEKAQQMYQAAYKVSRGQR